MLDQFVYPGKIASLEASAWNVPMRAPYRSAQRITTTAHNVLVRVVLDDGSVGFGESAPATYVTEETQDTVSDWLAEKTGYLPGEDVHTALYAARFEMAEFGHAKEPGARGALEMALLDATARAFKVPFLRILSDETRGTSSLQTDLSLPLLTPQEAKRRAEEAARNGYRAIKIKIGGIKADDDEARVRAIAQNAPQANLRLDGNQGFMPDDAVRFMERLNDLMPRIEFLEQPTKSGDDNALRSVQERVNIPVFADEAVHSSDDALRLLASGSCKGVVLKLAKSGVRETLKIANATINAGGQLMFGCMMETRLAISAALQLSAAIAADYGVQPLLDLDGHLLTKAEGMVSGGFTQEGDVLTFDPQTPGLGVDVVWPPVE